MTNVCSTVILLLLTVTNFVLSVAVHVITMDTPNFGRYEASWEAVLTMRYTPCSVNGTLVRLSKFSK